MSKFLPNPTSDGTYRIKLLDQDRYIQNDRSSNPGLRLTSLDLNNKKQKWKLSRVSGKSNVWTIVSVGDQSGLTYKKTRETYWGYGFPYAVLEPSKEWSIIQQTTQGKTFSKIRLNGSNDPFDSNDGGSNAINFYYNQATVASGPNQCYVFEKLPDEPTPSTKRLDLFFMQDATGSQQPYINQARSEINQICTTLSSTGNFAPGNLRVGLVAFRDHPPQDTTFITQVTPLTADINSISSKLGSLGATGGGDGPEAQCEALYDVFMDDSWHDEATKVAILITDAPPHGLGESQDGIPEGCPLQHDPVDTADRMAAQGIVLYVIACEPTLSSEYKFALDFYKGITQKTGGRVLPLGDANALTNLLVGAATESANKESLLAEHNATISSLARSTTNRSEISTRLYSTFAASGVQINTLSVEQYYEDSDQGNRNVNLWANASKISDVKNKIQPVNGPRIVPKYRYGGAPNTTLAVQPISRDQVDSLVQMSLARKL